MSDWPGHTRAKLGTLAHYKAQLDALEKARDALEADGADPDLIDELLEMAHAETLSFMACDADGRKLAQAEQIQREKARYARAKLTKPAAD